MSSNQSATAEIVCLLDDDQAVLKSLGRLLASDGFQVRQFSEPTKLLDYVQTRPVPLVVLDVWMEQMSGLEVQAKLANVAPQTRVIIMTGRKDPAVEQTARALDSRFDLGSTRFAAFASMCGNGRGLDARRGGGRG